MRAFIHLIAMAALVLPSLAAAQLVSPLNPSSGGGGSGEPWHFSPPTASLFDTEVSTVNTGWTGPTEDADVGLTLKFEHGVDSQSGGVHEVRSVLFTPNWAEDWTVTTRMTKLDQGAGNFVAGFAVRSEHDNISRDGVIGINNFGDVLFRNTKTDATDALFTAGQKLLDENGGTCTVFLRLVYTASTGNLDFYVSMDGKNFALSLADVVWFNELTTTGKIGLGISAESRLASDRVNPIATFDMWQTTGNILP